MKVITGFIYYFLLGVAALTCTLIIFVFRPFRKLLHKIQSKYQKVFNNQILNGIIYFSFAIIGLILLESVYSFVKINNHLNSQNHVFEEGKLQNLDLIGRHHHGHTMQDTLITIKQYKEYYMSQRNIMLTSSAFLAYFIFNRIFASILKLADIQNQIEHPQEKPIYEQKNDEEKAKSE